MFKKLSFTIIFFLIFFNTEAQNNQNTPLGINLAGITSWSEEYVFVDAMKCSRGWISQCVGCTFGTGNPLPTDNLGWVTSLPANHFAATVMLDNVTTKPIGTYNLYYEGEGSFDFNGDVTDTIHVAPGHIQLEVADGTSGIWVHIWETDPNGTGDYLKNIRLIMPGFENTYQTEPFHPNFLNTWTDFSTLRFMDWGRTNNSNVQTWTDRTLTTSQTQGGINGVAPEYMIALANLLQKNVWICIPHQADDNYITQLATLFRDNLDSNLDIYVEYSNEVWNGLFAQAPYASAQGLAQNLSTNSYEAQAYFHAKRSVEIFNIFETVFGGLSQLERVIAWQNFNTSWSQQILDYNNTYQSTDAFSIAPYFGNFLGDPTTADSIANMSVDSILIWCEDALSDVMEGCRLQAEITKSRGVSLIAYEGGQHLSGYLGAENNDALTAKLIAANRSDKMKVLYQEYYERWKIAGGELFAVFSSMGVPSKWGSWGILENYNQDYWTTPKYAATQEFTAANSPAWWLSTATTAVPAIGDTLINFDGDDLPALTVTQNRNFTLNTNDILIPFSVANGDNLFTTGQNQSEFYGGVKLDYKNQVVGSYTYNLSNYGPQDIFIADLHTGGTDEADLELLFLWKKDQFLNNYDVATNVNIGKLAINIGTNKNSGAGSDFRFVIKQNGNYYISDFMAYNNGFYELDAFNNSEQPAKRWYHYNPTAINFSIPTPLSSPFAMTFDDVEAVGFVVDNYRTGYGATFSFDQFQVFTKSNSEFTVTLNQAITQADVTAIEPIIYKATFSEPTSDFTANDITISGTATDNGTTATITSLAPNDGTTYEISITDLAQNGFVILNIDSLTAHNSTNHTNYHSTSTDNIVAFNGANRPTVTLNQATTQVDPTLNTPILFTAVFSESIINFDANDITLSGSANPTTVIITEITPNDGTTFQISVSGMSADGLVIVELAADKAITPLYSQGNEVASSTDNQVEFVYNIPTSGQLINFQGIDVPDTDFSINRSPQLSANSLSQSISFGTADSDNLFTAPNYNQVEIYGGVKYSFTNIGTSINHEMRRNDVGFSANQFWCQVAGGDGEATNIELFYLWRKDQFLNNLHLFDIGFDNNSSNSSLNINVTGKRENLDMRFVIRQNGVYYMSEFSENMVGLITLNDFNNNSTVGKRWGIITPTANDFSIPNILPTFQAVDFTNITAVGFICESPRSTYGNFLTFDSFTANGITVTNPLPVELINFQATCENERIFLNWQTATEKNNHGFFVEVGITNDELGIIEWKEIEFVKGKGINPTISNYIFQDKNEYSETVYYRLKQVDFDGSFEYSNVISIDCFVKKHGFTVFPNPTNGQIVLQFDKAVTNSILIYDVLGRIVFEDTIENKKDIELNLKLNSGIYFLKIGESIERIIIR